MIALGTVVPAGAQSDFPSLWESTDARLQRGLESTLARLGLQKSVDSRKLSVALVDITDPHRPRVAAVNGNDMMYAASLPKIAILLGAFVEVERGALRLDEPLRKQMTDMIRVSSNEAATTVLRKVGGTNLQQILQSRRYRLYDTAVNGGLWVGKEYGPSNAFRRDPLHNLSHGATVMQTARFYYMLETGQLLSPRLSRQMKAMLSEPGIQHKFVKGLQSRPGAVIYRKSGTWKNWHADSAIVEFGHHKYIIAALAEDPNGGKWLSDLAAPLHDLIVPTRLAATEGRRATR